MKPFKILSALPLLLLFIAQLTIAQTIHDVGATITWWGTGSIPMDNLYSSKGKWNLGKQIQYERKADNTLKGTITTTWYDKVSKEYKYITEFKGTYYRSPPESGKPSEMTILETSIISKGPDLPYGMKYCLGIGTLYISDDPARPGHYILSGKMEEACGRVVDLRLVDKSAEFKWKD